MPKFYFLLLGVMVVAISGCATRAVQTETYFQNNPQIGSSVSSNIEIKNVPFIEQSAGHCGPATLTMAMNWAGHKTTVDEIAKQVYIPGAKGSLQSDMISATRRNGLMGVPIQGLPALLKEIENGHPVIVFENLAFNWAPQWHYAIVFGYDLSKKEVLMHSGPEAFKKWDMEKFERSWMLGEYWGFVVLPADQLPATTSELENLKAAAGLEQSQKIVEANIAYNTILEKWPESLGALIGLGNVYYTKGEYKKAVQFLKRATKLHPQSQAAKHNLAIAEAAVKKK